MIFPGGGLGSGCCQPTRWHALFLETLDHMKIPKMFFPLSKYKTWPWWDFNHKLILLGKAPIFGLFFRTTFEVQFQGFSTCSLTNNLMYLNGAAKFLKQRWRMLFFGVAGNKNTLLNFWTIPLCLASWSYGKRECLFFLTGVVPSGIFPSLVSLYLKRFIRQD